MVRLELNSRPPAWQPDAQPTEPPVNQKISLSLDLKAVISIVLSLGSSGTVFQILVILLRYDLWKVKALHFIGRKKRVLGLLAFC